jgi:S-adenosylmethionine hydrolase
VNVNAAERTAAIEGLITWITTSHIERRRDATQPGPATTSSVEFADGTARGRVAEITDGYGNLFSSFVPADFEKLGLKRGDRFDLEINGRTFRVVYGVDYPDAARGAWVAFPRAEGVILFAINRGNAAQAAGASEGDVMAVRPVATP